MESNADIQQLVATILGSVRAQIENSHVVKTINVKLKHDYAPDVYQRIVVRYPRNQGPSRIARVREQFIEQLRLPRDQCYAAKVKRNGQSFMIRTLDPDLFEDDETIDIRQVHRWVHNDDREGVVLDTAADKADEPEAPPPPPRAAAAAEETEDQSATPAAHVLK